MLLDVKSDLTIMMFRWLLVPEVGTCTPILLQTGGRWVSTLEVVCPASVAGSMCPLWSLGSACRISPVSFDISLLLWFLLLCFGTFLVSHTTKCTRLILYIIYCFSLWISHFSKEHWFLILENVNALHKSGWKVWQTAFFIWNYE